MRVTHPLKLGLLAYLSTALCCVSMCFKIVSSNGVKWCTLLPWSFLNTVILLSDFRMNSFGRDRAVHPALLMNVWSENEKLSGKCQRHLLL